MYSELTALLWHLELSVVLNLPSLLSPSVFLLLPQLMFYLLSVEKKKVTLLFSSLLPFIFPFVSYVSSNVSFWTQTPTSTGAVHGAEPLFVSLWADFVSISHWLLIYLIKQIDCLCFWLIYVSFIMLVGWEIGKMFSLFPSTIKDEEFQWCTVLWRPQIKPSRHLFA